MSKPSRRRYKRLKMHEEGTSFLVSIIILFFISDAYLYYAFESKVAFWIWMPITIVLIGLSINFFRFPNRRFPLDPKGFVICPTDGRVVVIEKVYEPEVLKRECIQVSIFMTIFNVHAQWVPVKGKITYLKHHEGRFMSAYLPKSSVENERSSVVFETPEGDEILIRQVAGAVARRIVTYAEVGDDCEIGDPLGFIKFGSRVDLYLPLSSEVLVHLDNQVRGNRDVIARL
ncbi:phosphatidylserine decarboxylase family protein [Porphyromonadaceae bacterium W3.11]|nr:phosphatidylserine decarboxylase family protein [Porphyromonadaceae bacterium W3.11]